MYRRKPLVPPTPTTRPTRTNDTTFMRHGLKLLKKASHTKRDVVSYVTLFRKHACPPLPLLREGLITDFVKARVE